MQTGNSGVILNTGSLFNAESEEKQRLLDVEKKKNGSNKRLILFLLVLTILFFLAGIILLALYFNPPLDKYYVQVQDPKLLVSGIVFLVFAVLFGILTYIKTPFNS